MVKIFCILLARAEKRVSCMHRRLEGYDVTYIDAIDSERDLECISSTIEGYPIIEDHPIRNAEVACFLSHIKALREMVALDLEECIIVEDDIAMHIDFDNLWKDIFPRLPQTNLIMLCHIICGVEGIRSNKLFGTIGPKVYGTQAYWINQEYAREVLDQYDRPWKTIVDLPEPRITAEHITRFSGGIFLVTPLVIEITDDTYVQDELSIRRHHRYFSSWDHNQYRA